MGYKQFSYISAHVQKDTMEQKESKKEIALFIGNTIAPAHFASLMLDKLKAELSQLEYTLRTHRVEWEDILSGTLPLTFERAQICAIILFELSSRINPDLYLCNNIAGSTPDFNIFLLTSQEGSNEPFWPEKRALAIMPPESVSKT